MNYIRATLRFLGVIGGVLLIIWASAVTIAIWSDGSVTSQLSESGGLPNLYLPVSTTFIFSLIMPLLPVVLGVQLIMTSLGNARLSWLSGAFALMLLFSPGLVLIELFSRRALSGEKIFWILPVIVIIGYAILYRFKAAFFLRPTKRRLSLREQRLAREAQANQKS